MKNIFLMMCGLSLLLSASFTRDSSGVVSDSDTGLQWQDDYADNGGVIKQGSWEEAIEYCENLSLDGGGWHLPNIVELNSIVDFDRNNPSIDQVFQNSVSSRYWSSTTRDSARDYAWIVDFGDGYRNTSNKDYSGVYIRCVRFGIAP